jgi:hypothetical protein
MGCWVLIGALSLPFPFLPARLPELQPPEDSDMPAPDLEADDYTPPEPAPLPEEAVSRLLARADLRRKTAVIARDRQKSACAADAAAPHSPVPATTTPPAAGKAAHAVQDVEAIDTVADLLKAIRGGLRDIRDGGHVDLDDLARPARLWPEIADTIRSGDPLKAHIALAVAEAFLILEVEKEKKLRKASGKTGSRRRPAVRKAKPGTRKPATPMPAAPTAPPEEPMLDLNNDHDRLQAIRNTINDLKAGRPFDHRQADCVRIWPAMFRLATEQPAVNLIELFETCAARLARKIAGEERETDKPFGGHRAPREKKPAARKATSRPAPSAPDCGDVI